MLKLEEHERAAFFSSPENRCLPASTLKPEEREFVVDSGASMHMISKKDLSKAEMDTLTKSCSPTIVITANGEVQTHEEAIVYVKEVGIFLTMKVLAVGDMWVREREDAPNRDISPVPVSELVDDRTGEPVETQANKIPKTNQKETTIERGLLV